MRGMQLEPRHHPSRRQRSSGFTLIEIMAVVLIMGLLMSLVGIGVFGQVQRARVMAAKAQISQIESGLEFYRMDNSRYPTTEDGLQALITEPSSGARNYPPGGYLNKKATLVDPWDQPFLYESPGQHNPNSFDLWSQGADTKPGGEGTDADIGNWVEDRD